MQPSSDILFRHNVKTGNFLGMKCSGLLGSSRYLYRIESAIMMSHVILPSIVVVNKRR